MKQCCLCQQNAVVQLIDFGPQPVAHRFLKTQNEEEYLGPIVLGQCQACALIQQLKPMPVKELKPRFDWLTRSEPERHLDDFVQKIINLPGINKNSMFWGICWKEDSTLARLNHLGYSNTHRLEMRADLGIEESLADVETVQERFTYEQSQKIVAQRGQADIVFARHLIEHAFDVKEYLKAMKNLVKPHGYLILEIPDCMRSMDLCDYTTIWEEHLLYFTPVTFKSVFAYGGLRLVDFYMEEYPLENSYIGISQIDENVQPTALLSEVLKKELDRAQQFAKQWNRKKKNYKEYLHNYVKEHGKVAIFGAAHMCCAFINLLDLKDCLEFAVDDNPHKKGMFMPGSRLPIRGSSALKDYNIKLCLSTLGSESEPKVLPKIQGLMDGGEFKSIFPANPRGLIIDQPKSQGVA